MDFTQIHSRHEDRTAVITLNRPDKRNALNDAMVSDLTAAFLAAARDSSVKVIILGGEGPAFCAGADLEYLQRISQNDLEQNRTDSLKLAVLFRTIYEIRKPVIASVRGPALAGGCGLATVCDFVLASREKARFGYTEARIGFVPAIVMAFLIKRVGEGRARELVLRGNTLGADEAERIGLVTKAVPDAEVDSAVKDLAGELITQNSATSMGYCKELIGRLHGLNLLDSLDFAANVNAAARMTADCKQGVEAFLQKSIPKW
jgi:methylglutaconyl-CoA hydratase